MQGLLARREARAHDGAPGVVAPGSLEPPEKARVALLLVAVRGEACRADALHVPRVEHLVRDEREQIQISLARPEARRRGDEARARGVLQPPAPPRRQVEENVVGPVA